MIKKSAWVNVTILLIMFLCNVSNTNSLNNRLDLETIQKAIQNSDRIKHISHPDSLRLHTHTWSIEQFIQNRYREYIGNESILIFPLHEFKLSGLGNNYGRYIEIYTCANLIGSHFIGIWNGTTAIPDYFLGLPTVKYHPHPLSRDESLKKIGICQNTLKFPWEAIESAWIKDIHSIDSTLSPLIEHYINNTYPETMKRSRNMRNIQVKSNELFDFSNKYLTKDEKLLIKSIHNYQDFFSKGNRRQELFYKYDAKLIGVGNHNDQSQNYQTMNNTNFSVRKHYPTTPIILMPFIPNVVISIRCNDILAFPINRPVYGFLNFHVYTMIIPQNVETIYILTEPMEYSPVKGYNDNPNGQACKDIILTLVLFLTSQYTNANIAVMRGHQLEANAMIQYSEIVICTASTFCLWPGILNQNRVYFPLSPLVTNGKPFYITDHWNWISFPIQRNFGYHGGKDDRNRTKLMKVFRSLMSSPVAPSCYHLRGVSSVEYTGKSFC